MPVSYKNKIYMGRNVEWNQLLDKSKFKSTSTLGGVSIKNNGDGTYTLNGTFTADSARWFGFYTDEDLSIAKRLYGHKVLYGFVLNANYKLENTALGMSYEINNTSTNGTAFYVYNGKSCIVSQTLNKVAPADITKSIFYIVLRAPSSGTSVYKDVVVRPQLFDLTQMFGAGNEPATPEEFWSYFPQQVYPYNTGETQPLFKISRKRKLYMGRTIEWNQLLDRDMFITSIQNGMSFTNNGDGTIMVSGTAEGDYPINLLGTNEVSIQAGHKMFLCGCPFQGSNVLYVLSLSGSYYDEGNGKIFTTTSGGSYELQFYVNVGYSVNSLLVKPQLFDLTQMFGAGNEPATPEEFWSYFPQQVYPYNTGETQPLFKISRKSQWGGV